MTNSDYLFQSNTDFELHFLIINQSKKPDKILTRFRSRQTL